METYFLSAAGVDNNYANSNNVIFTIIDTKFYVPVVTLSFSKLLSKEFGNQFIGMNIKQKSENKNTTNKYRYFLESNFVGVNRFFFFQFIQIKMSILKDLKLEDISYQKDLLIIVTSSPLEKSFMINPLILI